MPDLPQQDRPVPVCSLLFERPADGVRVFHEAPEFFRDLNLDQIVAAVTAGRDEYDLAPFFHAPLQDASAIGYRHEVFRDLDAPALRERIGDFAQQMRSMRQHLERSATLRQRYQRESWFLDAVHVYGEAVRTLAADLARLEPRSRAFDTFGRFLASYVRSERFTSLIEETARVRGELMGLTYRLTIGDDRVTVGRPGAEPDYASEVRAAFDRFRRGAVEDYRVAFRDDPEMDPVEAGVLERVGLLYPDVFRRLDDSCARHADYLDPTVATFDREAQFYLGFLELVDRMRVAGLPFCYPEVSGSKDVRSRASFDVALALKLVPLGSPVVVNDFELRGPERIIVVTGPNQGGKTTFARTFGQLHHLAALGCLVPGSGARLSLHDQLWVQFERKEQLADLRGKLHDDLVRIRGILGRATPRSVVILNEIFTSTTARDALLLSLRVLEQLVRLDVLCVWVTFLDELASSGESAVSMVSTVAPDDPAVRTFRIVRRRADGRAYAEAIAAKYGLSYDRLKERLARESISPS